MQNNEMNVLKPIFIIGVGRSGSTIFHEMFSEHPNLVWLSQLCNRYPHNPSLNGFFMKSLDFPIFGRLLKSTTNPGENYLFWDYYFKGFRRPCRDLYAKDVTKRIKTEIPNAFSRMLTSKRNRILVKITGWSRVGFLSEIFNDAMFIHIVRDGRAVVNSLVTWRSWWGWRGPQNWRWGELTPENKKVWEQYDKSFVALASIEWKILIDAIQKGKSALKSTNFMEIRYEDLCSDPAGLFRKVTEFNDLDWSEGFERRLKKYSLRSANYRWREELNDSHHQIVEDILHDHLKYYGYL